MAKHKLPYIEPRDLIDIKISGHFYKKIQTVFLTRGSEKSKEEFTRILEKIKTNDPITDVYEAEIEVLVALCFSIEKAAKEQGKLTIKEIDDESQITSDKVSTIES